VTLFSKTVKYISPCAKKNFEVQKYVISMFLSSLLSAYFHVILPLKHTKCSTFRRLNFQNFLGSMPPGSPEAQAPLALVRSISSLDHTLPPKKSAFGPDGYGKKKTTLGCNVKEIQLILDAVSQC